MFLKKTGLIIISLLLLSAQMAGCAHTPQTAETAEKPSSATVQGSSVSAAEDTVPMRGIWLAYDEYAALGLSTLTGEKMYRDNADRFLEEAQKYGINTIFLHARAFDDAFWRSNSFHASKYLGADESLTAAEAYKAFDPFGVFMEEAHRYGMQVHAWLNPYRVSRNYYYDPGEEESIDRVLLAVTELLDYESSGEKVDGIHIDDYFYHALKGYYKLGHVNEPYAIVDSEENKPEDANNDPGWGKKSTILTEQIEELTRKGADGYVFFSAQYLIRSCAEEELGNLMSSIER